MAVVAEEEVSTVAGAVASTAEVVVSIARVVAADIVEAAPTEARGLSGEEATVAEALVADPRRATTERAGVRTADLADRAA